MARMRSAHLAGSMYEYRVIRAEQQFRNSHFGGMATKLQSDLGLYWGTRLLAFQPPAPQTTHTEGPLAEVHLTTIEAPICGSYPFVVFTS